MCVLCEAVCVRRRVCATLVCRASCVCVCMPVSPCVYVQIACECPQIVCAESRSRHALATAPTFRTKEPCFCRPLLNKRPSHLGSRRRHALATVRRLPECEGLLLKRGLQKQGSFAEKTSEFREPTNHGQLPVSLSLCLPLSLSPCLSVSHS